MMGDMETWHEYAFRLTPEQLDVMVRCDLNPDHPDGPEAHRRGLITMAEMYVGMNTPKPWWRRLR